MRRRAYRDVQEWWFYAKSRLDLLKKEGNGLESKVWVGQSTGVLFHIPFQVDDIITEMETREQVVLLDLEKLAELDGHADWRLSEARDLSALVQARLKFLQNPIRLTACVLPKPLSGQLVKLVLIFVLTSIKKV